MSDPFFLTHSQFLLQPFPTHKMSVPQEQRTAINRAVSAPKRSATVDISKDDHFMRYNDLASLPGMKQLAVAIAIALSSQDALRSSTLGRLELKLILKHLREQTLFARNPWVSEALPPNKPELLELLWKTVTWQRTQAASASSSTNPAASSVSSASSTPASRSLVAARAALARVEGTHKIMPTSDTTKAQLITVADELIKDPGMQLHRSPRYRLEKVLAHALVDQHRITDLHTKCARHLSVQLEVNISNEVFERLHDRSVTSSKLSFIHLPGTNAAAAVTSSSATQDSTVDRNSSSQCFLMLRMFHAEKRRYVPFNRSFSMLVNGTDVPIAEPNYYTSERKRSMAVASPVDISIHARKGINTIEVRLQVVPMMFTGLVLAELCTTHTTPELVSLLHDYAIRKDKESMRQCAICKKTLGTDAMRSLSACVVLRG